MSSVLTCAAMRPGQSVFTSGVESYRQPVKGEMEKIWFALTGREKSG